MAAGASQHRARTSAQHNTLDSTLAALRLIHVMRDHRNVKINLGLWLLREWYTPLRESEGCEIYPHQAQRLPTVVALCALQCITFCLLAAAAAAAL